MNQFPNKYDLSERTVKFGMAVIKLCKTLKNNSVSSPLINQLVRSGTSIGANYAEANNASSKKDFRNKIFLCKKEAQETKYWLTMLGEYIDDNKEELHILSKENQELLMIFQKICSSLDK
ncbi:MAG: four helix bundle protein [Patescibacteria group bacterium]